MEMPWSRSVTRRILTIIFIFTLTLTMSAQWANPEGRVPAYNPGPPKKGEKLPAILPPDQLWGANFQRPYQSKAYVLASKIPVTLHQQPCYCYCDRMGHNSLHSCFESTHGANCAVCLKELYYSYSEHQNHKTAKQIREGIIRGDWKQVDLEKQ